MLPSVIGDRERRTPTLVYLLFLVGLLVPPAGIVGVIAAYVNKGDGPDWVQSHFRFQIGTFWKGAIFLVAGALLVFFVVGYFVFLTWFVWLAVRCLNGLNLEERHGVPRSRHLGILRPEFWPRHLRRRSRDDWYSGTISGRPLRTAASGTLPLLPHHSRG